MDLNKLIEQANARTEEARRLRRQSDQRRTQAKKVQDDVRDRITQGESTGDRWRDIAILRDGDFDPARADYYRELNNEVATHVTEPVLMVCRWQELHGCTGFGGSGYHVLVETLSLGIIQQPELVVVRTDRGLRPIVLGLPTVRYGFWCSERWGRNVKTVDGNILEESRADFSQRDEPLEPRENMDQFAMRRHHAEDLPFSRLELVFGIQDVETWFKAREQFSNSAEQAKALFAAIDYAPDRLPLG